MLGADARTAWSSLPCQRGRSNRHPFSSLSDRARLGAHQLAGGALLWQARIRDETHALRAGGGPTPGRIQLICSLAQHGELVAPQRPGGLGYTYTPGVLDLRPANGSAGGCCCSPATCTSLRSQTCSRQQIASTDLLGGDDLRGRSADVPGRFTGCAAQGDALAGGRPSRLRLCATTEACPIPSEPTTAIAQLPFDKSVQWKSSRGFAARTQDGPLPPRRVVGTSLSGPVVLADCERISPATGDPRERVNLTNGQRPGWRQCASSGRYASFNAARRKLTSRIGRRTTRLGPRRAPALW